MTAMADDPKRQGAWAGSDVGWAIVSTLFAGMAVCGGLGYLGDRLLGTPHVLFAIGVVLGAGVGIYTIWLRFGREQDQE
jgi:ATP synthase protein I